MHWSAEVLVHILPRTGNTKICKLCLTTWLVDL